MSDINFEEDRVDSVTQIDASKTLSDKVIELRNLEDQITASEEHTKTLKEKAKQISNFDIHLFHHFRNVKIRKLLSFLTWSAKDFMFSVRSKTSVWSFSKSMLFIDCSFLI